MITFASDNDIFSLGPFGPNGPEDQDDHDPGSAEILTEFDLSLVKTHQALPVDFTYGTVVTYEITVTNEGDIDATGIEIQIMCRVGLFLINP